MSTQTPRPDSGEHPLPGADDTSENADGWRSRWESTQESVLDRFGEPIERATAITRATLAWFPVRVWRRFLQHNGFLLAAGISYQSLFTIFAVIYVAFAAVGFWLGASSQAIDALIDLINGYIPNLISDKGLITPAQVQAVATSGSSVLVITGVIAFVVAIWTAIGFITYTRRAARDIFGLPYDSRSYLLLKARDLLAAVVFGGALIAGSILGQFTTWALTYFLSFFGMDEGNLWSQVLLRILSLVVAFAINAAALAGLFKFLSGTSLTWRAIWPGSIVGGGAIAILQIGAGLLLSYTPSNPLLATFAVLVGFLVWFRLNGIVILVATSWIAVAAHDRDIPLIAQSEAERLRTEHEALLLAARIKVRTAHTERDRAPWFRRWRADRALRVAEDELAALEDSAPPPAKTRGLLD